MVWLSTLFLTVINVCTFLKKLQRRTYNKISDSKAVTRSQCDKHTQLLPTTPFSRPCQVALTASRADLSLHRKLSASPRKGTWDICGKNIKRLNLSSLANLSNTFLRLFFFCEEGKVKKFKKSFLSWLQLIISPLSSLGLYKKGWNNCKGFSFLSVSQVNIYHLLFHPSKLKVSVL